MITNEYIRKVAMIQSSYEFNCNWEDFTKDENKVFPFEFNGNFRKYYSEPISMNFISYGNNVIASAKEEYMDIAREYIDRFTYYHLFETPNMLRLNEELYPLNQAVCFMAEYYLPDVNKLKAIDCKYEMRLLEKGQFEELYLPQWSNAILKERKELDILAIGAYDKDNLIGLAGCSMDCENMWQIGIDVLFQYRKQGIASSLTSNLAVEILNRGKIPFYCSAWSNIASKKNAVKSGFSPSWVEMTVKPVEIIRKMNEEK